MEAKEMGQDDNGVISAVKADHEQQELNRALAMAIIGMKPREEARRLILRGADPCAKNRAGMDMLMLAASVGNHEALAEALAFGADPCGQSAHEETALCLAAIAGSAKCLALLAPVSDMGKANGVGDNALDLAVEAGAPVGAVDFLLGLPPLRPAGAPGAAALRKLMRRSKGDNASHQAVVERLGKEMERCLAEAERDEISKCSANATQKVVKAPSL